ncbi:MAG: DUF4783 domain-containing protein [Prevotellaceae bacterium]|jgi:hypothetical protein|nr:DUF4783 domain-containing protein [Prevotellaceae bacterium]
MKTFFLLFFIFPVIATAETPQIPCENLFDPIIKVLKNNSAEAFSNYFADAVEFDIFGENKIYSKLQAEQVVKTFFTRKSIKQIIMKHCSGKDYLKYAVAEITDTEDLLYRATIFVRIESDGNAVIQEVRLEKEE